MPVRPCLPVRPRPPGMPAAFPTTAPFFSQERDGTVTQTIKGTTWALPPMAFSGQPHRLHRRRRSLRRYRPFHRHPHRRHHRPWRPQQDRQRHPHSLGRQHLHRRHCRHRRHLACRRSNTFSPASAHSVAAGPRSTSPASARASPASPTPGPSPSSALLLAPPSPSPAPMWATTASCAWAPSWATAPVRATGSSSAVPQPSASGRTTVQVVNLGGLGALTTGNGIELVSALNGATTTAQSTKDAFALQGGHVDAGAYEYRLQPGDAAGAGENWYLRSTSTIMPASIPLRPARHRRHAAAHRAFPPTEPKCLSSQPCPSSCATATSRCSATCTSASATMT